MVEVHVFNSSALDAEAGQSDFQDSLVYREKPCFEKQEEKEEEEKEEEEKEDEEEEEKEEEEEAAEEKEKRGSRE